MTFDPLRICRILNEEGVDYVVIGGLAAVVHGSPLPTRDVDVVPDCRTENLERLARALARMSARIRTADEPVSTKIDGAFLANMPHMLNLTTDLGDLDLTFTPAGTVGDYAGWRANATSEDLGGGIMVAVASLEDIIDSKRSANRLKDQQALPYLESLRDEDQRQA